MPKLTGPFLRTEETIESVMRDVAIALMPALVAGTIFFGFRALGIVLLATITAMVCEAMLLHSRVSPRKLLGDGSALVTGMFVGLILPSSAAWWVPVIGSVFAIAVVKLAFGGLGNNIFNPALGARAFLALGFTGSVVHYYKPFDTVTTATPLLTHANFDWALVWGNVAGSIGETSAIAILLGGAYLFYRKHIDWRIPGGYIGAALFFAWLWGLDPWVGIFGGGLLFAAFFMATDMVTSPVTPTGRLLFGIGCGFLTIFIRKFTVFPEGVTFAILLMNAFVPLIDKSTKPLTFGYGLDRESRFKAVATALAIGVGAVGLLFVTHISTNDVQPVIIRGMYVPVAETLGTDHYTMEEYDGRIYYVVRSDEQLQKTGMTGYHAGYNGPIHFFLVVDADGQVEHVQLLTHQEDPGLGARLTEKSFLNQFLGKTPDSALAVRDDIMAITGATVSSRAFTTGVKQTLAHWQNDFYGSDEEVAGWADGVYSGTADAFNAPLNVEVEVADGSIIRVEVVDHQDTPGIADRAIDEIPNRIVAANDPWVDSVSGATYTADAIMEAVADALLEAGLTETGAAIWADGNYSAAANGYGGPVEVNVGVTDGSISAIDIVEHSETPGISGPAFDQIPDAIIAAQTADVDSVSGATLTADAIKEAVRKALDAAAAGEPASESPVVALESVEVAVGDGTHQGTAEGYGGPLTVDVTVADGTVTAVEVISHSETPGISAPAIDQVPAAIVVAQSTDVDSVSGATVTSDAIKKAVAKALSGESSAVETEGFNIQVGDGTYSGTSEGYGGPLTVEVVVADGQVTSVEVTEHSETPFLADPAIASLIEAMLQEQGYVDAVSGATVTSEALASAVTAAISGEGAE